ncbi:MAG: hypothetical protein EB003_10525 [Flavobacteriia bacterium]|nr:hypothetical protein [Flavobacteriia bacterium]
MEGLWAMYKAQYKARNAYESWTGIGSYGSESEALNAAMRKKNAGAFRSEQSTHNRLVTGSSPVGPTIKTKSCLRAALFLSALLLSYVVLCQNKKTQHTH